MEAKTLRPTALVTGASSGIGQAYARLLAAKGYDLWLVARRGDRLESLAQELSKAHPVGARFSECDLSDRSQVAKLCAELAKEEHLEVLVHNAGFGVNGEIGFAEVPKLLAMAEVHVAATIALTSAAAPILRRRGRGAIVVVSSIAGRLTGAGSATYCATKAFETSFAVSLGKELKPHGVAVQALCPGYTMTEFHDTPEYVHWKRESVPRIFWSKPEDVALASWNALGKSGVCIPGALNKAVVALGSNGLVSSLREKFRKAAKKG